MKNWTIRKIDKENHVASIIVLGREMAQVKARISKDTKQKKEISPTYEELRIRSSELEAALAEYKKRYEKSEAFTDMLLEKLAARGLVQVVDEYET